MDLLRVGNRRFKLRTVSVFANAHHLRHVAITSAVKKFLLVLPLSLCLPSFQLSSAPVEIISPELHGAIQPQVAVSPEGHVHVTFGKGTIIYHVSSTDGGRTFSKPVEVAGLPQLALGMRRGPRVAATDKTVVVSAISHSDGDLHAWTSTNGGTSWKESRINDAPHSAREGLHAMAADGKGLVAAVWLDDRNGGKEVWSAVSQNGGETWIPNVLVYKSPDGHVCECCHPSIAVSPQGNIAIMWRNWLNGSRDMYEALSSDGGKTFGLAQKLGSGTWRLNGCPMDGGSIAFASTGKPLTAWRREKIAFASEVSGPEQRLGDLALQPVVTNGKSGAYYIWESGGGLMLKKARQTRGGWRRNAMFAAAAALPNRGAIVVWQSELQGEKTLLAEVVD